MSDSLSKTMSTMGKAKVSSNSHEVEKFSDSVRTTGEVAKDQLGVLVPTFSEQLVALSLGKNADSSPESYKKPANEPLVVQDPVSGAYEVFKAASQQAKPETKKHYAEKAPKAEKRVEAAIDHAGESRKSSERASQ